MSMTKTIITQNSINIAAIHSNTVLLHSAADAMDLIAAAFYEDSCTAVILNKEAVAADFFVLRTGLAGGILQKFTNYRMRLALIGDFSAYTSKPLRDFIGESNRGRHVCFAASVQEALAWLSKP